MKFPVKLTETRVSSSQKSMSSGMNFQRTRKNKQDIRALTFCRSIFMLDSGSRWFACIVQFPLRCDSLSRVSVTHDMKSFFLPRNLMTALGKGLTYIYEGTYFLLNGKRPAISTPHPKRHLL